MLGFVEIIFSIIGIVGYVSSNTAFMLVGLIGIIVGDFIDIFISGHNPSTIIICILMSIGATIANHSLLYNFTLFLCGENITMSVLTLILIGLGFLLNGKKLSNDHLEIEKTNNKNKVNLSADEIINEFMEKSNLSKNICTDIYNILLYYIKNEKEIAENHIQTKLIPHLKEENIVGNVGIAFGMLIGSNALTQEEANKYSVDTIKQMLNTKMEEI